MHKSPFITLGTTLAFFAVAFGAFGAHGLKNVLSAEYLSVYHTAVDYQMWHSIGLVLIGLLFQQNNSRLLIKAGWLMFAGIVVFSGSLYALSLTGIKILGAITPIGGIFFLTAWALFAYAAFKS
ncbi:MAG: hypothetical protein COB26_04700 [Piscirickettsiaceae bacterium]|nr:MAG: hypothetical protein COB89_00440 [Piscirickettsiaceae bacterium]PCI70287.1 MAG: hypothetical protein COB26_04700 [Piscirickettsiaceae bacterium]